MRDELFTTGVDAGEFLIKAQLKVPVVQKFESPVLQDILERLQQRYATALEDVLEAAQQKLLREKAAKALQFIVLDGGLSDDLVKADAKPKKEREKDGGYNKVGQPGSRGGKFWIDAKGHVRYDERPGGPGGSHREATEEEVVEHVGKMVSPTIFVGLDDDTYQAALEAGHFSEDEASMVEFFREQLNSEQVLGGVEGIHDISDIDARAFQYGGKSGAEALHQWLEEWWYDFMLPDDEEALQAAYGDDRPSKAEVRQWFNNLLDKYSKAIKSEDVQERLKLNFVRLQKDADSLTSDIERTAKVSEKMGDQLSSPENLNDAALAGLTLMKGMNLVFLPTSGKELGRVKGGKTNKRMKGQIHVNEAVVGAYKSGKIDLEDIGANEAQAMMLTVASHLSAHKDQESGEYDSKSFRHSDGSLLTDLRDLAEGKRFLHFMEQKKGAPLSDGERKHYAQRISELGEKVAQTINDQHEGKAPGVEEIMASNAVKLLEKPDAIAAIKDKISDNLENTQELLDAQEDTSWTVPAGPMTNGRYGGEGKNVKDLKPHQINPQTGKAFGMFPWQKQAINWMEKAERGILAHGAGLGKTTSAVAFVEAMKAKGKLKRGIFFLPPALIPQWTKEIEDYAPGNTILDLSRFPAEDREAILKSDLAKQASYILVSKGVLTGGGEDEGSPTEQQAGDSFIQALSDVEDAALLVDEVHQGGFKDPKNAASKITQKVLTGRKYAFGMTATPLPNSPKDLFHLTDLFAPGTLGNYATWEGRLAETTWNPDANDGVGGYEVSNWSDLADLNRRAKPRVFVKKFDDHDVAPELAKVLPAAPRPEIRKIFLSEKAGSNGLSQQDYVHHGIPKMVQKRIEELMKEREEAGEEPWGPTTANMVAKLLTLNLQRQATISPELIDPKWKGDAPKIRDCVDHIIDHFKPGGGNTKGKGIVVFCNFKKAFPVLKRELAARGIDPSIIGEVHGDSEFDRGSTQDAFNGSEKDGKFESKIKIMLVGIKAGGAGLNLQKGGNASYFLDEPFTAADKEQAVGRVFRVGQREPVKLTTVMAHNSYDEAMNSMISSKNAIAQALLARDPNKVNELLNTTANLLGVEKPAPPDPKLLAKFDEMANLVQVRKGSVDDMWDSINDDDGGTLQDNEVVVNPKAAQSLPPALRTTHDMKAYVRERRAKMASDGAEHYAKMFNLVAEHFAKQGDNAKAKTYRDRAERMSAMVQEAKGMKKDAPKSAPVKAKELVKEIAKVMPVKAKESTAFELTGKRSPYDASSNRKVDSKRDLAFGVTDKSDHLTHSEMSYYLQQVRKHKVSSVKEMVDKIMKPGYQAAGQKADRKEMVEMAARVLHHLKEDGLVVHS